MTNYPFKDIETFNDVAVVNEYKIVKKQGGDVTKLLDKHKVENRDNSRTPMQWDDSDFAGFSQVEPWFPVNPNYKTINVAQQQDDPDSILNFYKSLINLKKSHDIFTYGIFNLVDPDNSQIFAYTRELGNQMVLVVGNLTDKKATLNYPINFKQENILLHNYKHSFPDVENIQPYESFVIRI